MCVEVGHSTTCASTRALVALSDVPTPRARRPSHLAGIRANWKARSSAIQDGRHRVVVDAWYVRDSYFRTALLRRFWILALIERVLNSRARFLAPLRIYEIGERRGSKRSRSVREERVGFSFVDLASASDSDESQVWFVAKRER